MSDEDDGERGAGDERDIDTDSGGGRFGAECPRCEAPIDGGEQSCRECGLEFIDEEGGLSDDAIEAMMADVDVSIPKDALQRGTYIPGWVRLMVALAITVPLAPVVALIVVSVVPLPGWVGGLVLGLTWLLSGYALANYAVATLIVANGLLLTGGVMTGAPLLMRGGRALFGTVPEDIGDLGANAYAAQELFLLIGAVVLAIGVLVRRHALATKARWERQRQHPQEFVETADTDDDPAE